jgi:hypothetical protein
MVRCPILPWIPPGISRISWEEACHILCVPLVRIWARYDSSIEPGFNGLSVIGPNILRDTVGQTVLRVHHFRSGGGAAHVIRRSTIVLFPSGDLLNNPCTFNLNSLTL